MFDEVGVSEMLREICCCCPAGDVADDGGDKFIEYGLKRLYFTWPVIGDTVCSCSIWNDFDSYPWR